MDYRTEYYLKNPTLHSEDAPLKFSQITAVYKGRPNSIIDLGCGSGTLTLMLAQHYQPSYMEGIDLSGVAIQKAEETSKNGPVQWKHQNVYFYKPGRIFDLAICSDLLEHVRNPKQLLGHVSSFSRKFIVRIPIEKTILNDSLRLLGLLDEYSRLESQYGHLHHFSLQDVATLSSNTPWVAINSKLFPLAPRKNLILELFRKVSLLVNFALPKLSLKIFGGFVVILFSNTSQKTFKA